MTAGDVAVKVEEPTDSGHDSAVTGTPDSDRPGSPGEGCDEGAETYFKLTIVPAPGDSFDITVNSAELMQEVHQILLEREQTCHRTCFSLSFNGQLVDNFTEIRNVPGLQSGCTLNVVEEPYTVREVRVHIRHLRELLRGQDVVDSSNAIEGASLSFLPTINMQEVKNKELKPFEGLPPDHVLPGSKDRSLGHLLPPSVAPIVAVRNVGISSWNPPPGPRKLKGDLVYLYADTVEKRRIHITGCTKGFFVNDSTDETFSPTPSQTCKTVFHTIVDLLSSVSAGFKKAYAQLAKKRTDRHLMERLPTPYPVHSWVSTSRSAFEDYIRAEDCTLPHRIGYEDHLPGQIRDWNEELQTTHEMARECVTERIVRDRSVFKIHGDFIGAALRGAAQVVDGNVMAINPADDPKTHMFIWNNIFYSLGFDVKDHYKELGGDPAAFAVVNADLQGVKAMSTLDISKLHTLGIAVVDYRGYRITAQSIIPGILESEQDQLVVYGSIDFGKTVKSDERYHELLEETAKALKILPHDVITGEGEEEKRVRLYSSFETKGIIGNDSRQYLLDLLRTMPPDANFVDGAELSDRAKTAGFPRKFPHKLANLRHELVDSFYEDRYINFMRLVNKTIREELPEGGKNNVEEIEKEITTIFKEITEGSDFSTENAVVASALKKAAESVHSLSDKAFDIRFNPDCYSTTVKHAPEENLEKQRTLLREASEYIIFNQLPELVTACLDHSVTPIDGRCLVDLMHSRGINVRYLGDFARLVKDTNSYVRTVAFMELVSRCVKHVLRPILFPLQQDQLASAVAHILNCIFGPAAQENGTQSVSKRPNKKAKKPIGECGALTAKSLWKSVCDEAQNYYGFAIEVESADALVEKYGIQKISLLRSVCRAMGIQLNNKDYSLDTTKAKLPFSEDDVYGLYPVSKHRHPSATDARKLYQRGQQMMALGALREAYESTVESVNLMTAVYGALHPELSQCLHMLARLAYANNEPADALQHQHKATIISERCLGLDHSQTILEYLRLSHFAFANYFVTAALRILYRARYLLLLAHGDKHPLMVQIDGNIGVILFACQEFETAVRFLQSAEAVATANETTKTLKFALLQHVAALCHAARGDYRSALTAEKDSYSAYNTMFGPKHEKTMESSEFLKMLTQHAVLMQKSLLDPSKATLAQLLPLQVQQPALSSILEVLNIMNGIIFLNPAQMASGTKDASSNTAEVSPAPAADVKTEAKKELDEPALD